jgi:hypothetical protein
MIPGTITIATLAAGTTQRKSFPSRKITRRDRTAGIAQRCHKYNAASRKTDILDDGGEGLLARFCYFGIQPQ